MNDTIDKLMPLFQKLSDQIGKGGAFAWDIAVRQQYVYALEGLLFALVFGPIIAIAGFKFYRKGARINVQRQNRFDSDGDGWKALGFGLIILASAFLIFGLDTAITHFINPQYYALDYFFGLVGASTN